ncbi:hypothetical protein OSB04_012753 [Centaurea solstitialis]|uniref:Uncharacterized protein n=1 Tax=Centaurea solstitialis TaxID=347529 RepID=A0AA38WQ78_9ASTR|nr:hypothetical protein OSB04_012753 [Centaurea solstitialis]
MEVAGGNGGGCGEAMVEVAGSGVEIRVEIGVAGGGGCFCRTWQTTMWPEKKRNGRKGGCGGDGWWRFVAARKGGGGGCRGVGCGGGGAVVVMVVYDGLPSISGCNEKNNYELLHRNMPSCLSCHPACHFGKD